jgi:KDO2-lipid IV(A) lauroyltransferase
MATRPRQWFDFALLYLLYKIAGLLPRRGLLAWGRAVGSFVFRVVRYRRGIVLDNLQQAFGSELDRAQLHRLAHAFYRNLGMTLMEFMIFPRLDQEAIRELVDIEGSEHLAALVEHGRGGLLVSGHFGNWELLGARVAAEGHKVSFLVKTQSNRRVDRLQNQIRHGAGIGTIRTGSASKEMVHALRRGELVGLLADQDAGGEGFFTEFLGRQASVFRGTAHFAYKLRCPILTGYIYRLPDGRHLARLDPPLFVDPQWDDQAALAKLTEYHVSRLEAAVRQAPEQYFWLHRRWKTRPPDTTG